MQTFTRDDTVHGIEYVLKDAAEDAINILRERLKTAEHELSILTAERDHYRRQSKRLKEERDARTVPLAAKNEGMRVCGTSLLSNPKRAGIKFMLQEMDKHLKELSRRYYAGDIAVVDEFLQLYSYTETRPVPPVNEVNPVQSVRYLIIKPARSIHGMLAFYAPKSAGYTICTQLAGRFTEAEAAQIVNGAAGELIALRESDLDHFTIQHVIDKGYANNNTAFLIHGTAALPQELPAGTNLCPCNFPHMAHDACDGSPASTRNPVNEVNPVQPDTTQPFAFLDMNSFPWMVMGDWLHRWHRHEKKWVTARALVEGELPIMAERRLKAEDAALYGYPFTPPAASPTAPPHPPASTDDTPHSSAPESAPPAPSPAP